MQPTKPWRSPTAPPPTRRGPAHPRSGEYASARWGVDVSNNVTGEEVCRSCSAADKDFRKKGLWAFECVNSGQWSTTAGHLDLTAADVVLSQEAKLARGHQVDNAEQSSKSAGWDTVISPCTTATGGGNSAGVGISVKAHLGLSDEDGGDRSLDEPRFMLRKVGGICKGEPHVGTACLHDTIGLSHP